MQHHRVIRLVVAFTVGIVLALYSFERISDPEPALQRAREEGAPQEEGAHGVGPEAPPVEVQGNDDGDAKERQESERIQEHRRILASAWPLHFRLRPRRSRPAAWPAHDRAVRAAGP